MIDLKFAHPSRLLARAAIAATFAASLLTGASQSGAEPATVKVADNTFQPGGIYAFPGQTVIWSFEGEHVHTVTSNTGFFDSGSKSSGTFSYTFRSAGSYGYHCRVHDHTGGRIYVGMTLHGNRYTGFTLEWATAAAPRGWRYNVQYRLEGRTAWKDLWVNTAAITGRFDPTRPGNYELRARTHDVRNGHWSGWSLEQGRSIV